MHVSILDIFLQVIRIVLSPVSNSYDSSMFPIGIVATLEAACDMLRTRKTFPYKTITKNTAAKQ